MKLKKDRKDTKEIKNKIVDELIDLECPMHGNYFEGWLELLLAEYNKEFKTDSVMERYKYIAKKINNTPSATERSLLYGKDLMVKRIREKYNIKTKITNETVILLFKLKIF